MYDADLDALAAEYVLGTLAADERDRAASLLDSDAGFADLVRQWERRLGELNVMVEAVEPPGDIWKRIKSHVGALQRGEDVPLAPIGETGSEMEAGAEAKAGAKKDEAEADGRDEGEGARSEAAEDREAESKHSAILTGLASNLLAPEGEAEAGTGGEAPSGTEREPKAEDEAESETESSDETSIEDEASRSAVEIPGDVDVAKLARRVRRWRWTALFAGALAVLFAAVIAVPQMAPGLVPSLPFSVPHLFAPAPAPGPASAASQRNSFVAVLQHSPTAPAFLVTVDAASRSLTVRRVGARPAPGHAYQLWLLSTPPAKPRSLGLIGADEFTQRPLPADITINAMRNAKYEISFERAGGSSSGTPMGPILFRGSTVVSVPPLSP